MSAVASLASTARQVDWNRVSDKMELSSVSQVATATAATATAQLSGMQKSNISQMISYRCAAAAAGKYAATFVAAATISQLQQTAMPSSTVFRQHSFAYLLQADHSGAKLSRLEWKSMRYENYVLNRDILEGSFSDKYICIVLAWNMEDIYALGTLHLFHTYISLL